MFAINMMPIIIRRIKNFATKRANMIPSITLRRHMAVKISSTFKFTIAYMAFKFYN